MSEVKKSHANEFFKGFNHKNGKVDLNKFNDTPTVVAMRPTEIHLKENGSADNKESFVIVFERPFQMAYGEITLQMLNQGLSDIGYKIVKTE